MCFYKVAKYRVFFNWNTFFSKNRFHKTLLKNFKNFRQIFFSKFVDFFTIF